MTLNTFYGVRRVMHITKAHYTSIKKIMQLKNIMKTCMQMPKMMWAIVQPSRI